MIELELTETAFVLHDNQSTALLKEIKSHGFNISLDDFGTGYTGYTGFNQLQHYPVDVLKIDRSFVDAITNDKRQNSIVDVVLAIADNYEVKVVAEGVETKQQLDYLQNLKCDFFQGYYLSKPLAWEVFYSAISTNKVAVN